MVQQKVKGYKRKPYRARGKLIKPKPAVKYNRKKRPKSKKRIVGKKPVKLYPVFDEYGQRRGWKRKK